MKRTLALLLVLMMTVVPFISGSAEAPKLAGELKYMSLWNETDAQADVIKAAIAEFTEIYPDVKISVDWMGRKIADTIMTNLDAQTVDIWDGQIARVIVDYSAYGLEMSEWFDKPMDVLGGKTYAEFANPALIQAVKDQSTDGLVHGLPYQPNIVGIWYNPEVFAEVGVTTVPETWEELMDLCKQIKDAGKIPFSLDSGYANLPFAMYLGRLMGMDWNREMVLDKTGAKWDDPGVLKAAQAMEYMAAEGYFSPNVSSNVFPQGQNDVALGDAAMYVVASYMPNECVELTGADFEWGAFAFPSPEGAALDNTHNTLGMQVIQVVNTTKYPEAAVAFAMFLTTGKYDTMMSENTNAAPAALDTPWPKLIAAGKSILDSTTVNVPWAFRIGANSDVAPVIAAQLQNLCGGVITAEEFIKLCKDATMN